MRPDHPLFDALRAAPFHLDDKAVDWVRDTAQSLTPRAAIAQLFNIGLHGPAAGLADEIIALQPGAITRFFHDDAATEMALLDDIQAGADVPLLVSADLEGSAMSLSFGTVTPNPLAMAAADDPELTRAISRIMAEEARAVGVNWTFTPVLDINAAFRSAIVATRGYGSDVAKIARHALVQADEFQKCGVAACVKHWPGEGYDDRDQHLVTTINPLSLDEWEDTFGRLYRAAFAQDTLSVMSAHIALPAYIRQDDPDAGLEAYRPASLSHKLTHEFLRERLGFNGVIVSDASEMSGATAFMEMVEAKIEMLRAGCDMVLFTGDLPGDIDRVTQAVAEGTLSQERLDSALIRVLGLKARLGLHLPATQTVAERRAVLKRPAAQTVADQAFAMAPTLVKDVQGILPVNLTDHRRILFLSDGINSPLHGAPQPFDLPEMLRAQGFEVHEHVKGAAIDPRDYDLALYAFGEETLLTRGRIFLDWLQLTGDFRHAMQRLWHDLPVVMLSFGYPYYLYDAPRAPCYINAYCTVPEMQKAVMACLLGQAPFAGTSPVDPFCGLEDARY